MFNEVHANNLEGDINLAFIKSANIQAYPCGRRRSTLIDRDGDTTNTTEDKYYFPFDPEARLNTEANNRKYSSVNGFTQTYLKSYDTTVSLSLGGYLFNINLDYGSQASISDLGDDFVNSLVSYNTAIDSEKITNIYANILLEETPLYSGFKDYTTLVLRNQSNTDIVGEINLDLLNSAAVNSESVLEANKFENYYFSGLSFSDKPLTRKYETRSEITISEKDNRTQQIISLCILDKKDNAWQVHQQALLPKVEHGADENSVELGNLRADSIRVNTKEANGSTTSMSIPSLKLVKQGSVYQLQFANVDTVK